MLHILSLPRRVRIALLSIMFIGGMGVSDPAPALAAACQVASKLPYKAANSPGVYYISEDCRRIPIQSPEIYFSYFASWNDVRRVAPSTLYRIPAHERPFLPWGPRRSYENGTLMKTEDNPRVYLLTKGVLHPIDSEAAFLGLGLAWSWVETVTPEVIARYEKGPAVNAATVYPESLVFTYRDAPEVYLLKKEQEQWVKEHIPTMAALRSLYRLDRISILPRSQNFPFSAASDNPSPSPVVQNPPPAPQPVINPSPFPPPLSEGRAVSTVTAFRQAFREAKPGDVITLAAGTYSLDGVRLETVAPGRADAPITVRAARPGDAVIQTNGAEEAFLIHHPYYIFENLHVQVNGQGSYHAYKLDTDGHDVVIRGGKMEVFRGAESGVKGSSSGRAPYPDNLLVENTEIFFREPTTYGVAEGIDGVGMKGWKIRNNTFHGIKQANRGRVAFAVVLKGNSQDTLIEGNTFYDNDIAISIGGTSSREWFRDGDTTHEHRRAIVRNNVSVNTKDVALYIERGNETRVYNNTFVNTFTSGGNSAIDVRFSGSTADIKNNILDKKILNREGGAHTAGANVLLGTQYALSDFISLPERNLRPKPGTALSAAIIDKGEILAHIETDKDGRVRRGIVDIGAYEIEDGTAPIPEMQTVPAESAAGPDSLPSGGLLLSRESNHGLPGMYGGSFGTADFDEDGDADVVVVGHFRTMFHASDNPTGGSEEVRLYRNESAPRGAIRFELQQVVPNDNGSRGATLDVGDFNGDGKKDFAVETRFGGKVASFMNEGGWRFTRVELPFSSHSISIEAADVNQDGRDDLIFNSDGGEGGGLWYTWNTGSGRWDAQQTSFPHRITYGGTLAAGDLTGDGYPEIAVGGNSDIAFGSHHCGRGAVITSGDRLMYGQTHRNLGGNRGFASEAHAVVSAYGLKVPEHIRADIHSCHGMDNAQMEIADLDLDGHNDVIIAGSSTGQNGAPGNNGQHYDFAALFNIHGTGRNFHIWENIGPQDDRGTTNGGVGNLDFPSIAVGDLTGDNYPEVLVQGHRRDYLVSRNPYIFENIIFVNNRDRTFTPVFLADYLPRFTGALPPGLEFLSGRPRYVAEGGVAIADFNRDGTMDVLFSGAELPYHTNGVNARDYNTAATIATYILRNTR